jgi:hypothetical protein
MVARAWDGEAAERPVRLQIARALVGVAKIGGLRSAVHPYCLPCAVGRECGSDPHRRAASRLYRNQSRTPRRTLRLFQNLLRFTEFQRSWTNTWPISKWWGVCGRGRRSSWRSGRKRRRSGSFRRMAASRRHWQRPAPAGPQESHAAGRHRHSPRMEPGPRQPPCDPKPDVRCQGNRSLDAGGCQQRCGAGGPGGRIAPGPHRRACRSRRRSAL